MRLILYDAVTDADWDRFMAVNLTAPVRRMEEVIREMRNQKSGVILNMASPAGMSGAAAGVAYTASTFPFLGEYHSRIALTKHR
jgi:NAD(P)-dependent dehydrogenase (short-subunit alcohol dehydrogenase family)